MGQDVKGERLVAKLMEKAKREGDDILYWEGDRNSPCESIGGESGRRRRERKELKLLRREKDMCGCSVSRITSSLDHNWFEIDLGRQVLKLYLVNLVNVLLQGTQNRLRYVAYWHGHSELAHSDTSVLHSPLPPQSAVAARWTWR